MILINARGIYESRRAFMSHNARGKKICIFKCQHIDVLLNVCCLKWQTIKRYVIVFPLV